MTYSVQVTARAERDIKAAHIYIKEHGPADPRKWKAGLKKRFKALENFPKAFPLAPENFHVKTEIRQLLYGPFRVLFTVRSRTVYILTVRHGARLPFKPGLLNL